MMTFRRGRLQELGLPAGTVRPLIEIAESKGRQQFYEKQNLHLSRVLRAAAFLRSIESSNRFDGVTVAPDRLPVLAAGRVRPRNRPEEEIRGYARALNLVYAEAPSSQLTPHFVRRLHEVTMEGAEDAGQWRLEESDIFDGCGVQPRSFSHRAVCVTEIEAAMEELCMLYTAELKGREVHSLLAVAAFVLDFLCIHPFREGNGRISRLLVLLTLCQQGFEVGRYISLERFYEASRDDYCEALQRSSERWHEGKHDPIPWLNYFFSVLRSSYLEFEQRTSQPTSPRGNKIPLVEAAIDSLPREFVPSELERTCPGVSRSTVWRVVRRLRKKGSLLCRHHGGTVTWEKAGDLLLPVKRIGC
jgi:Fic family protein